MLPPPGSPLKLLIVGINPGLWTAAVNAPFAHPGNRFWPSLFRGGLTDRLVDASAGLLPDDEEHLHERGIGITNLVGRASARADELSRDELREGGARLVERLPDSPSRCCCDRRRDRVPRGVRASQSPTGPTGSGDSQGLAGQRRAVCAPATKRPQRARDDRHSRRALAWRLGSDGGYNGSMKMLLTDAGITNPSIEAALVELLGKPIEESVALDVPTALHPGPNGAFQARKVVAGLEERSPYTQLPWKVCGTIRTRRSSQRWDASVGSPCSALPTCCSSRAATRCSSRTGCASRVSPSCCRTLQNLTYVGLSAGSMVMTPSIGEAFTSWEPPERRRRDARLRAVLACALTWRSTAARATRLRSARSGRR